MFRGIRGSLFSWIILFFTITSLYSVNAENFDISDKFSSTDTVLAEGFFDIYNSYDFHLEIGEKVEYKVEVVGLGYVQVFLATENDPNILSEYIIDYSTEEEVKSFSKTFRNSAKYDTKDFSIIVFNPTEDNVTYKISIKIFEDVAENTIIIVGGLFLIIGIPLISLFVVRYLKHQKAVQAQTQAQSQAQTQAQLQAQAQIQQPGSYPCNFCGQPMSYIAPNRQWYCDYCRRYY